MLATLSPLINNPKLDKELQLLIQESFPDFCRAAQNNSPPTVDGLNSKGSEDYKEMDSEVAMIVSSSGDSVMSMTANVPANNPPAEPNEPAFSDDEDTDDMPIATKMKMKGKAVGGSNAAGGAAGGNARHIPAQLLEVSGTVAQLEGDVRLYVEMLMSESDNEARCSAVENLVQTISQEPLESDQVQLLVQSLHAIFQHDLTTSPFFTGDVKPE